MAAYFGANCRIGGTLNVNNAKNRTFSICFPTNVVRSFTFMIYTGEIQRLMKKMFVLDARIPPPAFSQWNKQIP